MIVYPYKRPPEPPRVALLTEDGWAQDERGQRLNFDEWPDGTRCFGSFDTVRGLIEQGKGEAVCWMNEEIHWRHARLDREGWKSRPSDVHVLRLPFPDTAAQALRGLARWRSWLGSYGASPTGTSGSAAWSLLRATLGSPLRTGEPISLPDQTPPIPFTVGGRQEIGPGGPGTYTGELALWDLPAAYASTLGSLPYGGRWVAESSALDRRVGPEWWSASGAPVFVRCVVEIHDVPLGPLPRRPRTRRDGYSALGLGCHYPTATRLQGCWTWQELQAMTDTGAGRIVRVLETYGHLAGGRRPFRPWWDAIVSGREVGGLAGQLAKLTGNALWGRFCVDARFGRRTIRSRSGERTTSRALPMRGGQAPAHDLAETVSGRVRAELYRTMTAAGNHLISAHTDGVWVNLSAPDVPLTYEPGDVWRCKEAARRLDLLGPQSLRYWPRPYRRGSPVVVWSGEPPSRAAAAFERAWAAREEKAA